MALQPTSFRFAEDTKTKLEYICLRDKAKGATEVTKLIEDRFDICLKEQLQSIVSGESKNAVDELVYLLDNKFISKEYFLYSLPIPPKIRFLVLDKLNKED